MDGMRKPVGKLPAEVYWRRRIVVIVALVAVVAVGWLGVRALTSGGDEAVEPAVSPSPSPTATEATTSPSPSPSPSVTTSAQAATIADCTAADVAVALAAPATGADAATFPVTLENTGAAECLLDGGTGTSLLITSGDTRVWMSTDCEDTAALLDTSWLLQPGASETVEVTWPREWSFEGCRTLPDIPQPGSYWAELQVQDIPAERLQFQMG